LLTCQACATFSQELRQKHTVIDENLGLTDKLIIDLVEDSTGLLWLLSENNLYWFDGSEYNKIPHGNSIHQIPGNVFSQLYRSPEEEIWIVYNKGYSIYNPTTHSFSHFIDIIPGNRKEVFNLVAVKEFDLIFRSDRNSFSVNRLTKKIATFNSNTDILFHQFSKSLPHNYLATSKNNGILVQFFNNQPTHFISLQNKKYVQNAQLINDSLLILIQTSGIVLYNLLNGDTSNLIQYPTNGKLLAYNKELKLISKNKNEILFLLDNELWIFHVLEKQFTNKIVSLNGKNLIDNGYYKNGYFDKMGNLWVSSNLNGLIKISFKTQPIHLIGNNIEDADFIKCFMVNKSANCILAGTYGKGLLLYDTIGNLIKQFPLKRANTEAGTIITSIGQLDQYHYLVFAFSQPEQYIINIKTHTIKPVSIPTFKSIGYYQEIIQLKPGELLYSSSNLNTTKIKWQQNQLNISFATVEDRVQMEAMGNIKLQHQNIESITANPYFTKCIRQLSLDQAGRLVLQRRNTNWLIGTIKGIFEFDKNAKLLNTYNKDAGMADEYIYGLVLDNTGDIWCSHNKGISRISKEGNILNLTKSDGLQSDEFNYGAAAKTEDGQLFFGGIKGLNSFYPTLINNQLETPKLLVTHISTSDNKLSTDTAFWNIRNIELPFAKNSLKIKVSAIGNFSGDYYNYQYRVKGLFSEWKNLGRNREINLALPSGKYILEMACSNSFMKNAIPQKSIFIKITPPFYLRWWFIVSAIATVIGILFLVLQAMNRHRYQKKLATLKMQQQVENERRRISRDLHDNMGAYTTALLSNVEKLKQQNKASDDLNKMESNAVNILSSLRETIWVLNNREISIAEFSDNFKNYCIKMLQNFDSIEFESEEHIIDDKNLPATEALHFDKILKEAFQNILKHSGATHIIFKIESHASLLCFTIEDNGKGFNMNTISRGYGLENMQWRAKEAGAIINITNNHNKTGTSIYLKKINR